MVTELSSNPLPAKKCGTTWRKRKMDNLDLGNTQTSGFATSGGIDLSKTANTPEEFVLKFADFAARMLDFPPHKRDWQTHILTLYDEAVSILENKQV